MSGYQSVSVGPMAEWKQFRFQLRDLPPAPKRFLKAELALTAMEISVNCLPPGAAMPFLHQHRRNEEVYLFLTGDGEFQAGEDVLAITPGVCIRCAPATPRSFRNTGAAPMEFVVIQAEAGSYTGQGETTDGELAEGQLAWS